MASRLSMRGKVVLVPFPFDDLSGAKVRPAVCLTEPIGPHRHVVLAFASSVMPPSLLPTDLLLDPNDSDFTETGLRVRSALRLHRLITVTTAIIRRELGVLSAEQRQALSGDSVSSLAWPDWQQLRATGTVCDRLLGDHGALELETESTGPSPRGWDTLC